MNCRVDKILLHSAKNKVTKNNVTEFKEYQKKTKQLPKIQQRGFSGVSLNHYDELRQQGNPMAKSSSCCEYYPLFLL